MSTVTARVELLDGFAFRATVPMRFGAGEPFHAGLGWQMMEVGLKGMSAVLAD